MTDDPEDLPLYAPGSDEAIRHYQEQLKRREPFFMPGTRPPKPPKFVYCGYTEDVLVSGSKKKR